MIKSKYSGCHLKCKLLIVLLLLFTSAMNVYAESEIKNMLCLPEVQENKLFEDYKIFTHDEFIEKNDFEYECYGKFKNGEVVTMRIKSWFDTDGSGYVYLGKYRFHFYSSDRGSNFYLHNNDSFIHVADAYKNGLLTDEDVNQIVINAENSLYIEYVEKIEDDLPITDEIEICLSETQENKLFEDYKIFTHDEFIEKNDFVYECYGEFKNGEVVTIRIKSWFDTDGTGYVYLGKYRFHFYSSGRGSDFYLHSNDSFIHVADAYKNGLLTDEDVDQIVINAENSLYIEYVEKIEDDLPITDEIKICVYFKDVQLNDWFHPYIDKIYEEKLMIGMDKNTFEPFEILSRAQFATILSRMENKQSVPYDDIFNDVAEGEWYTEAVLWAAENDIVTGYENGCFGPADYITREQMAVMLYRYAEYKGYNTVEVADLAEYPDVSDVSSFAEEAVSWCVAKSIISGNDGKLLPQGNTTRAECVAMISRFVGLYE